MQNSPCAVGLTWDKAVVSLSPFAYAIALLYCSAISIQKTRTSSTTIFRGGIFEAAEEVCVCVCVCFFFHLKD